MKIEYWVALVALGLASCGGDGGGQEAVDADGDGKAGSADCNDASAAHWNDCTTCIDADHDDYGTGCNLGADCDDSDAACDADCVEARPDIDGDGRGSVVAPAVTRCVLLADYVPITAEQDCDDEDERHWSDCTTCGDVDDDGRGNGCDLGADCDDTQAACTSGCVTAYFDRDGDTHGGGAAVQVCAITAGYAATADDCDDTTGTGAACNTGCLTVYADPDGDGHGSFAQQLNRCSVGPGTSADGSDCAPADPDHWADCGGCSDSDLDDRGNGCDRGTDCNDGDVDNWQSCLSCFDYDHDTFFSGCDAFTTRQEDCDDHDPTVHPGAIDFPDSGVFEDCEIGEPRAADGDGIYVDADAPGCGTNEQGTRAAPFCTLMAAFADNGELKPVFVASGDYQLTYNGFIYDQRVFGGYDATFTNRDPSPAATTITSTATNFGVPIGNFLMQNVKIRYTADCEGCTAIAMIDDVTLADVIVEQVNTQQFCAAIYTPAEASVALVRVTIAASAACVAPNGILHTAEGRVLVWKSSINVGVSGTAEGAMGIFTSAHVVIGESSVVVNGDQPHGVLGGASAVLEVYGSKLQVNGVGAFARGILAEGESLAVENTAISVTSNGSTAAAINVAGGNAQIFHNTLTPAGNNAYCVDVGTGGAVRVINNVLAADGVNESAGIFVLGSAAIDVLNNDFQLGAATDVCPVDSFDNCIVALSGAASVDDCLWSACNDAGANFASSDCVADVEGRLADVCMRVDRGFDMAGVIRYALDFEGTLRPIDYPLAGPTTWDVGRYELQQDL